MASFNITTAPQEIAPRTNNKRAIIINNPSDTDIYCSTSPFVTATADANTGIPVKAGGNMTISPSDDYANSCGLAWYAVHAGTGNKQLIVNFL